jgi:hypothetical protein
VRHVTLGRQPLPAKAVVGLVGSCFLMCRSLVYSSQVPLPLSTKGREARWFRIDRKYTAPKQIADTSYFGPILSAAKRGEVSQNNYLEQFQPHAYRSNE